MLKATEYSIITRTYKNFHVLRTTLAIRLPRRDRIFIENMDNHSISDPGGVACYCILHQSQEVILY